MKLLDIIHPNDIDKYSGLSCMTKIKLAKKFNWKCVRCSAFVVDIQICYDEKTGMRFLKLRTINSDGIEDIMTKDHIFPVACGGKNTFSNYQLMCQKCNRKKGSKIK